MQSVVAEQAPITLERKITSGGKQIKTEDNTHNWNKSYTSDKNKKARSAHARVYIYIYYFEVYAIIKRVAAETETEKTA